MRPVWVWAGGLMAVAAVLGGLQIWQHRLLPPVDRSLPALAVPQAQPLRLTLIGTSLTARPGWPEALKAPLERCLGTEVLITRITRAGANSRWGLNQAAKILETRPDLVTLEFSGNDADLHGGVSLRESRENHRQLIHELRASRPGLPVLLMVMSPKYGLPSLMRPLLPRYTAIYPALAEELDTGLLDFYPRWLARPWQDRGLQGDGQHPDSGIATKVMVPVLVAYIGQATGKHCGEWQMNSAPVP